MAEINDKYILNLADQIRNTDDCQALALIVDQHLQSLLDLIHDIIKEQASIIKSFLPILDIPFPDPKSIVSWIKKLVAGTATQQLTALINYTVQLIKLSIAIASLAEAIAEKAAALAACGIVIVGNSLERIATAVDTSIASAFQDINTTSNKIRISVPGTEFPTIPTASREEFLKVGPDLAKEYSKIVEEHLQK